MRTRIAKYFILAGIVLSSCKKEMSNGETIFRTGKNKDGKVMLNQETSSTKGSPSCEGCHGRTGGNILNKDESIKYKDLSDPKLHKIPYTDSLLIRFLDEDLKSDGTKVDNGLSWKMDAKDKLDLLDFLKTL